MLISLYRTVGYPIMIDEYRLKINLDNSTLRQIRDALELTQLELANYIGVSENTVSRWEIGKRDATLTLDQIIKIDELLAKVGLRFSDLPAPTFAAPNAINNKKPLTPSQSING